MVKITHDPKQAIPTLRFAGEFRGPKYDGWVLETLSRLQQDYGYAVADLHNYEDAGLESVLGLAQQLFNWGDGALAFARVPESMQGLEPCFDSVEEARNYLQEHNT